MLSLPQTWKLIRTGKCKKNVTQILKVVKIMCFSWAKIGFSNYIPPTSTSEFSEVLKLGRIQALFDKKFKVVKMWCTWAIFLFFFRGHQNILKFRS